VLRGPCILSRNSLTLIVETIVASHTGMGDCCVTHGHLVGRNAKGSAPEILFAAGDDGDYIFVASESLRIFF